MKLVIQRVTEAGVTIDGEMTGQIDKGLLVLVGIGKDDTREIVEKLTKKMLSLRIFEDADGKTNLDISSVDGQLLIVSQFTLYANCKKGNRPSFVDAAAPDFANELYEYMIKLCRQQIEKVQTGRFGADMKVSMINDGPFTIILDSRDI